MKNYGKTFDKYYVALGTPLCDDAYTIDYQAFRRHVKHFTDCQDFIDIGGAIIVLPEAGEIFTFTREEKKELIKIAIEEGKGKLPVFAGVSSFSTRATVDEAKDAQEIGVDGLFIMPPGGSIDLTSALNKEKNPYAFLNLAKAIAKEVDLPFIAHAAGANDPVFGSGYPVSATKKIIQECPNFIGWKMMYAHGPYISVAQTLRAHEEQGGQHVGVLCAGAQLYFDMMNNDLIDGAVSCHWNYSRDINIKLIKAYQAHDFDAMKHVWIDEGLRELHNAVGFGSEYGFRLHTSFKVVTWLKGLIPNPYVREPMVQAFKQEVLYFRDVLRRNNMDCISDDEINKVLEKLPV